MCPLARRSQTKGRPRAQMPVVRCALQARTARGPWGRRPAGPRPGRSARRPWRGRGPPRCPARTAPCSPAPHRPPAPGMTRHGVGGSGVTCARLAGGPWHSSACATGRSARRGAAMNPTRLPRSARAAEGACAAYMLSHDAGTRDSPQAGTGWRTSVLSAERSSASFSRYSPTASFIANVATQKPSCCCANQH